MTQETPPRAAPEKALGVLLLILLAVVGLYLLTILGLQAWLGGGVASPFSAAPGAHAAAVIDPHVHLERLGVTGRAGERRPGESR